MKIIIKNMVCLCCEVQVRNHFETLGINPVSIRSGEVILAEEASESQLNELEEMLNETGLAMVHEGTNLIVERMKSMLQTLMNEDKDPLKVNLSAYMSDQLRYNYSYLSNLFSKVEGTTIRDYMIRLRIERAKRMLVYEGLDLLEVSCRLHYSSAAHLAAQFKKITGMTTTEYRRGTLRQPVFAKMVG
jgi:YesN/AraC family two-component response regulator